MKGVLGKSSLHHVAETCVTTWSVSSTRPGRKVGCLCPRGPARPSAGYGPQGPTRSPLPGMLTSRPTEAINANMLIFPLKYLQTLQHVSVCDIGMQSWVVAVSYVCMNFVMLLDCAQLCWIWPSVGTWALNAVLMFCLQNSKLQCLCAHPCPSSVLWMLPSLAFSHA